MNEELELLIDAEARAEILTELGSMNAFYDRLGSLVARESGDRAAVAESTGSSVTGAGTRGGDLVTIVTAVSGLIAALSPIVIAWIRARGLDVTEKSETRKDGTVIRTLHLRRGAAR